jgi:hypothetical protein
MCTAAKYADRLPVWVKTGDYRSATLRSGSPQSTDIIHD